MSNMAPSPVYGLVLAGGHSTRMKRDKATLTYHGRTQLEWAMSLLEGRVSKAFVSIRPGQSDPVRAQFEQIVDTHEGLGPIAGILAAQARYPEAAWLVLACDLPFLDGGTLDHLLAGRDPARQATAYRSSHPNHPRHNGLPEPLCAIYEPSSREAILATLRQPHLEHRAESLIELARSPRGILPDDVTVIVVGVDATSKA